MPVSASTVAASSCGPPMEKAALSLFSPWPGISTNESRGRLTSTDDPVPLGTCSSRMVSVRCPAASASVPVASSWAWASVSPARESLPTSRNVVPGVEVPDSRASTVSIARQATQPRESG